MVLLLRGGDIMRIDTNEIIGVRIAKLRKSQGYTQAELAEIINLSPTEISNIERGKNNISFSTLLNLCNALKVDSSELLSGAIKDTIDDNIIDLIKTLDTHEKDTLYLLLHAYIDNKNIK